MKIETNGFYNAALFMAVWYGCDMANGILCSRVLLALELFAPAF